jgi:Flp pilus assembly protein CpaB
VENLLPKGLLGTPRRTVVAGVVALVLATILLLVYLSHYRNSVKSENAAVPVLTAKQFIPKGTSALDAARRGLYVTSSVPKDRLVDGAISDAAAIHGQEALDDIYPDTQLTVAQWGSSVAAGALSGSPDLLGSGRTQGTWRAMAVNLDDTHGLIPQTQTGDHVDVYVYQDNTTKLLMTDMLILAAPNQTPSGTTAAVSANYILRVPSALVRKLTRADEAGKLWFALRPQKGAKPEGSGFVGKSDYQ